MNVEIILINVDNYSEVTYISTSIACNNRHLGILK